MNDGQWQLCTDPKQLFEAARTGLGERKLRLLACAAGRRLWHLLHDARSRNAIEVAEQYADGQASYRDLSQAAEAGQQAAVYALAVHRWWNAARTAAAAAATNPVDGAERAVGAVADAELVREIVGSPFRAVTLADTFRTWNDGCTVRIARGIYDERRFGDLPVLADALEESGCSDGRLLAHLRSGESHYRGCWAMDLILRQE